MVVHSDLENPISAQSATYLIGTMLTELEGRGVETGEPREPSKSWARWERFARLFYPYAISRRNSFFGMHLRCDNAWSPNPEKNERTVSTVSCRVHGRSEQTVDRRNRRVPADQTWFMATFGNMPLWNIY